MPSIFLSRPLPSSTRQKSVAGEAFPSRSRQGGSVSPLSLSLSPSCVRARQQQGSTPVSVQQLATSPVKLRPTAGEVAGEPSQTSWGKEKDVLRRKGKGEKIMPSLGTWFLRKAIRRLTNKSWVLEKKDPNWGFKLLIKVWSLLRRFDQPQKYKPFISRCVIKGDLEVGSLREVNVKSGLPATTSTERLECLDDSEHILSFRIIGGDHRLKNYSSIMTAHPEKIDGRPGTLVIESFVVDVPEGNTKDETCYFVEAFIKCNLKSLAEISERLTVQDWTNPIDY